MTALKDRITPTSFAGLDVFKAEATAPTFNMLVYGDPGVGKTRLAGSADDVPSMRKVLFVDVEAGTMSLRKSNPNVDVVRVQTWAEMQQVYDALFAGDHGYRTVVVDSLTEIQKFNMYEIMQKRVLERDDLDPDVPGMREWGKNLEQMRRYVRAFRDLPVNTIFTALCKADKDVKTGVTTKKPYLSGKLADEVAGFLDIVTYMYMKEVDEEVTRLLLTGATDQYVAKDRTGELPFIIENPTMMEIIKQSKIDSNENEV